MLCDECGKNEAAVHIQRMGPGEHVETRNLCIECMLHKNIPGLNIAGIKEQLMNAMGDMAERAMDEVRRKDIACPSCGTKYGEFIHSGKVGCEQCYELFREDIMAALSSKYKGKLFAVNAQPEEEGAQEERTDTLVLLRKQLSEAIAAENYEAAASIRDNIRALNAKGAGAEA